MTPPFATSYGTRHVPNANQRKLLFPPDETSLGVTPISCQQQKPRRFLTHRASDYSTWNPQSDGERGDPQDTTRPGFPSLPTPLHRLRTPRARGPRNPKPGWLSVLSARGCPCDQSRAVISHLLTLSGHGRSPGLYTWYRPRVKDPKDQEGVSAEEVGPRGCQHGL